MNTLQSEQVNALFETWNRLDSPGCAVGIYSAGEIIYQRGFGSAHLEHKTPNTPATVFHIASLSKQFTAMAVALLARAGKLSLDDDIRQYVPELCGNHLITLRHIIQHTSGLRDQWDLLRLSGWREADLKTTADILTLATRQQELNFPTGSRFQYINTGYTLLGIAIERVAGKSLRKFADENIFQPLGMRKTFFQDDYQEIIENRAQAYSLNQDGQFQISVPAYETVGPTGLFSTVEDFVFWERNFLAPEIADADFYKQLLTLDFFPEGKRMSYASGFLFGTYKGLETIEHAGGDAGYRAHFLRLPSEHFAVAIFCNFSEMKPAQLAREIADICLRQRLAAESSSYFETPAASRAAGVYAPSLAELESRCGQFKDLQSGTTCRIELREGRLFLVATGGGIYELIPLGTNHFRFLNVEEAEIVFSAATENQSERMIAKYAGQETGVCERIVDEEATQDLQLAEFAGVYESDELATRLELELAGEELLLRRVKFAPSVLRLVSKDEFSANDAGIHLCFVRDEAEQLTELRLSSERVWHVRFTRL